MSGGVATGITAKLTAMGFNQFKAMIGGAAASGFSFELLEQTGANVVYLATGGADGRQGLQFDKLLSATALSGGAVGVFAVAGKAFGWLASKVLPASAASIARGEAGNLAHEAVPAISGKTRVGAWGKFFDTPLADSMTLASASNWLVAQGARIAELVSGAPTLKAAVDRAYQLLVTMREGAKAALYRDPEAAAILEARYPIPSKDTMLATVSRANKLSGDSLYSKVLDYMTKLFQRTFPEMVGGCFIAGTLVHTDQGLVPIEQIKVGDRVLSQPEETGERAYKRVVNTFAFDDKAVWVVKYSIGPHDGSKPNQMVFHLYATDNHPFWVDGKGWIAAKCLKKYDQMRLASGEPAQVEQVWPVVRTPVEGLGWVSSDMLNSWDGIEQQGHIVDFRGGCSLWKYQMFRKEELLEGVPHYDGMFYNDPDAPFLGEALYDIYVSDDPLFKTRVYNLEVEDFHTYYVGELGVWVHNRNCVGLELLNPARGARVPDSTQIFETQGQLSSFINRFVNNNGGQYPSGLVVLPSPTTTWITTALERGVDVAKWIRSEDLVRGRLVDPLNLIRVGAQLLRARFEPALMFKNSQSGNNFIRGDGYDVIAGIKTVIDSKMGLRTALKDADARKAFLSDTLRRTTKALEQNRTYNWLIEFRVWPGGKAASEGSLSLREVNDLLTAIRNKETWLDDVNKDNLLERIAKMVDDGRLAFKDAPPEAIPKGVSYQSATPGENDAAVALTFVDLLPVVAAARQYWLSVGATEALLAHVDVQIGDLPAGVVGATQGKKITLSANAAGWGWYADPRPADSAEFLSSAANDFLAAPGSPATDKLDLLTVLIHEMGHAMGLGHASDPGDEMSTTIVPGTRRLPVVGEEEWSVVHASVVGRVPTSSGCSVVSAVSQYDTAANPTLTNPEFANGTAWSTTGDITFASGAATLKETPTRQTRLSQA
ncbi:MAG TPA: polymorphic toxin-type HINT domain-containing protein, partial [Rhodocyclaceae bacterium]|nr:polymorphic toxin-type HINT domain-containing protein [Rhodocyclaceae bacterium]